MHVQADHGLFRSPRQKQLALAGYELKPCGIGTKHWQEAKESLV